MRKVRFSGSSGRVLRYRRCGLPRHAADVLIAIAAALHMAGEPGCMAPQIHTINWKMNRGISRSCVGSSDEVMRHQRSMSNDVFIFLEYNMPFFLKLLHKPFNFGLLVK